MTYVLGLDSGGTKTLLALMDRAGQVIGLSRSASLDPSKNADWPRDLAAIVGEAAAAVGGLPEITAAAFGLSFHGEVADYSDAQTAAAEALLPGRALVENDVRIAFDGAFVDGGGVLILAGTGSMVWASRNGPDDPHLRIGGWGDAFGDEGSAFWIGREALAITSQTLDGRAGAAALTDAVLASISVGPTELLAWCYQLPDRRARFAALAAVVGVLADAGDADAGRLITTAADHLADHADAACRQLDLPEGSPWSYAGSVFNCRLLLDVLTRRLGSDPVPPRLPPIGGALIRAARRAGWNLDGASLDRLAASLSPA